MKIGGGGRRPRPLERRIGPTRKTQILGLGELGGGAPPRVSLPKTGAVMSTHYCHSCAVALGMVAPTLLGPLQQTQYQLSKFIKHTAPTGTYPKNSIFHQPDHQAYEKYIVTAAASGYLEIDDHGRKNLIYFAGQETGLCRDGSGFSWPCSGVTVVLSHDLAKAHAFPADCAPECRVCANCGCLVPFDARR